MLKGKKSRIIFAIVFFQIYLCTVSGLIMLVLTSEFNVTQNVWVDELSLANMKKRDLTEQIEKYFNPKLRKNSFFIKSGDMKHKIDFQEIDVKVDSEQLKKDIVSDGSNSFVKNNIQGFFLFSRKEIELKLIFNEIKLRQLLIDFSKKIDKKAKDAKVWVKNGQINSSEHEVGYAIDIDSTMNLIKKNIKKFPETEILLKLKTIEPNVTRADLKSLNILGSKSISKDWILKKEEMKRYLEVMNELVILPTDVWEFQVEREFSFSRLFAQNGLKSESSQDICNLILRQVFEILSKSGADIKVVSEAISDENGKNTQNTSQMFFKDIRIMKPPREPIIILVYDIEQNPTITIIGKKNELN